VELFISERIRGGIIVFGFIGNFGPWELLLILVIVLIIVGPGKLPQVGQSMGKALQNFRKAKDDEIDELEEKDKK
jgi:sec-independent protein translocase protein TatA